MIPISTYTLHHLTDEEKAAFIKVLLPLLKEDGHLFIKRYCIPNTKRFGTMPKGKY